MRSDTELASTEGRAQVFFVVDTEDGGNQRPECHGAGDGAVAADAEPDLSH